MLIISLLITIHPNMREVFSPEVGGQRPAFLSNVVFPPVGFLVVKSPSGVLLAT